MKILFLLLIPIFFACNSTKEVSEEKKSTTSAENVSSSSNRIIGTVHIPENDCPYIEAIIKEKTTTARIYPINLDEKYKIEGIKIKFEYAISRMSVPEGCSADYTAKFYEVEKVR